MVTRDQHTASRSCTAKASVRAPDSAWRAKICYAQWEDVGPFNTDSAGDVLVISDPPRTSNIEPASMSRPPFEIIWDSDFRAWLTGDLFRKRRGRLGPGQCVFALKARGQEL